MLRVIKNQRSSDDFVEATHIKITFEKMPTTLSGCAGGEAALCAHRYRISREFFYEKVFFWKDEIIGKGNIYGSKSTM